MSKPRHSREKEPVIQSLIVAMLKRIGFAKAIVRSVMFKVLLPKSNNTLFEGYKAGQKDVFVATYFKSGTNWMLQIAQQIADLGDSTFKHIHDVVPWPEAGGPKWNDAPVSLSSTGLRVIKTHLNSAYVPYDEKAKYLVVIRDPKEVFVSSFHFFCGILDVVPYMNMKKWFDVFSTPDLLLDNWVEHTAGYWAWRDRPNVYVISYANLKKNSATEIEKIAQLLGVELTEQQLAQVIERASFKYMKEHGDQFAPPRSAFVDKENTTKMIRRGETGAKEAAEHDKLLVAIDKLCQQGLKDKNSDFPYSQLFDVKHEGKT